MAVLDGPGPCSWTDQPKSDTRQALSDRAYQTAYFLLDESRELPAYTRRTAEGITHPVAYSYFTRNRGIRCDMDLLYGLIINLDGILSL